MQSIRGKVLFVVLAAVVALCVSCENEVEYVYEPSISVAAMPEKTSYFVGEKLDLTGLRVSCVQKDGSVVDVSDYTAEPADGTLLEKAGKTKVTVTYKTQTLSFSVVVSEITASRLYLKTAPKSAYYDGETLDLSNIKLILLKTDGSEETVSDFTADPANGTVLSLPEDAEGGTAARTVMLSYGGLSCSFDVSVYAVRLRSLAVKSLPAQTAYYVGDTLNLAGLALEAVFSDGTIRDVTGECHIPFETTCTEEGMQTVTVSFLGADCTFSVTVLQSFFSFCEQPQNIEMPLYAEKQTLSAAVVPDCDGSIVFSWYRKQSNESAFTKIAESEPLTAVYADKCASVLTLPKTNCITAEYYCAATLTRGTMKKTIESDKAAVVQLVDTGLPCLKITTNGGTDITSKEEWLKGAKLTLAGADNDDWNFNSVSASIHGRGNSTWGQPKKPYAVKFDKKQEIMGMPAHKRWVLLANYLDNSFMRNCMAFYLSRQLEMNYTVRGEFVRLILNGEFKGLYWLGEAIKADKNRVDIDEDSDYLIELDAYYDEVWKFKSAKKNLPYMIKNDDSMTDERLENLQEKIALLEASLYPEDGGAPDESYAAVLDIDSWAKFYLVNELMSNYELCHPKSCYFTFNSTDGVLKAGPVWDFDWASLSQADCALMSSLYYDALFKSPLFIEQLKKIWNECCEKISTGK